MISLFLLFSLWYRSTDPLVPDPLVEKWSSWSRYSSFENWLLFFFSFPLSLSRSYYLQVEYFSSFFVTAQLLYIVSQSAKALWESKYITKWIIPFTCLLVYSKKNAVHLVGMAALYKTCLLLLFQDVYGYINY